MNLCKILVFTLFCLFSFDANSEEINISVDKNIITESDTVFLTIEYTGDDNGNPDLGELQNDFNIVSNSSSRQFSYINGQLSQSKTWKLELAPKRLGKISIKPIKIGQLNSNYAEVEVKEVTNVAYVPDSKVNSNSPFFQIEQSIFPKNPYVQQQVIITLTVYDSIGLQNATMHIQEESLKDWIVTPLLDRPIVKQDVINGKHMNVITFAFAAFPQKSGEIKSPLISFDGYYLKSGTFDLPDFDDFINTGISFLNNFSQKVPVRMRTKIETVNVKPIPSENTTSYWLPLKDLKIMDKLSSENVKVGEAFNREIQLTAVGMQEKNLPQLSFPSSTNFKQYPEKPINQEKVTNGDITTYSTINIVYIPVKAGTFVLPEFTLEWFNINNNRFEKAIIPARNITVLPNSNIDNKADDINKIDNKNENVSEFGESTLPSKKKNPERLDNFLHSFNHLYLKVFLLFIFIIFLFGLLFSNKNQNPYTQQVINAIKKHDYSAAKTALINWAKTKYNKSDIKNFQMIADIVQNDDFAGQLHDLNKILYSNIDADFDNVKFIATFKKIDKLKKKIKEDKVVLPHLYQ